MVRNACNLMMHIYNDVSSEQIRSHWFDILNTIYHDKIYMGGGVGGGDGNE